MTTYWFKPKRYGYGATPVTWQGWAITLAFAAVVITATIAARTLGAGEPWAAVALLAIDIVAIGTLWIVSRRKTEGEWRWRWGGEQ